MPIVSCQSHKLNLFEYEPCQIYLILLCTVLRINLSFFMSSFQLLCLKILVFVMELSFQLLCQQFLFGHRDILLALSFNSCSVMIISSFFNVLHGNSSSLRKVSYLAALPSDLVQSWDFLLRHVGLIQSWNPHFSCSVRTISVSQP